MAKGTCTGLDQRPSAIGHERQVKHGCLYSRAASSSEDKKKDPAPFVYTVTPPRFWGVRLPSFCPGGRLAVSGYNSTKGWQTSFLYQI